MTNQPRNPAQTDSPRPPDQPSHGENLDRGAPSETAATARGRVRGGAEQGVEAQRSSTASGVDRRPDEPDDSVNSRSDGGDGNALTARETD